MTGGVCKVRAGRGKCAMGTIGSNKDRCIAADYRKKKNAAAIATDRSEDNTGD